MSDSFSFNVSWLRRNPLEVALYLAVEVVGGVTVAVRFQNVAAQPRRGAAPGRAAQLGDDVGDQEDKGHDYHERHGDEEGGAVYGVKPAERPLPMGKRPQGVRRSPVCLRSAPGSLCCRQWPARSEKDAATRQEYLGKLHESVHFQLLPGRALCYQGALRERKLTPKNLMKEAR